MAVDPVGVVCGRVSRGFFILYHSKSENYLPHVKGGWKGRVAGIAEQYIGRLVLMNAEGIIGVTEEIAAHNAKRVSKSLAYHAMPNGVDMQCVRLAGDKRAETVSLVIAAGTFRSWKGLEEVLDALEASPGENVEVHVAGQVNEDLRRRIGSSAILSLRVRLHGTLAKEELRELYVQCDAGLGSFGLAKVGMRQAASLKVGEYLASGLPVLAGHEDARLPADFPYYRHVEPDLVEWKKTARAWRQATRETIRGAAEPYIDKVPNMQRTLEWLRGSA